MTVAQTIEVLERLPDEQLDRQVLFHIKGWTTDLDQEAPYTGRDVLDMLKALPEGRTGGMVIKESWLLGSMEAWMEQRR